MARNHEVELAERGSRVKVHPGASTMPPPQAHQCQGRIDARRRHRISAENDEAAIWLATEGDSERRAAIREDQQRVIRIRRDAEPAGNETNRRAHRKDEENIDRIPADGRKAAERCFELAEVAKPLMAWFLGNAESKPGPA